MAVAALKAWLPLVASSPLSEVVRVSASQPPSLALTFSLSFRGPSFRSLLHPSALLAASRSRFPEFFPMEHKTPVTLRSLNSLKSHSPEKRKSKWICSFSKSRRSWLSSGQRSNVAGLLPLKADQDHQKGTVSSTTGLLGTQGKNCLAWRPNGLAFGSMH